MDHFINQAINKKHDFQYLKYDRLRREKFLCQFYHEYFLECLKRIRKENIEGKNYCVYYVPLFRSDLPDYKVNKAIYYIYKILQYYKFDLGFIKPNKIIIQWKHYDFNEAIINRFLEEEAEKTQEKIEQGKKYLTFSKKHKENNELPSKELSSNQLPSNQLPSKEFKAIEYKR